MLLTVAVPTYDRNEVLLANLARLLPQLTPEVGLLVLDNHSPRPVEPDLAPLLAAHPHAGVRVVRHACNVGGNANIMRCFELATTPWVWVLGDDDEPFPNAVETLLSAAKANPDAHYLNFSTTLFARPKRITTVGRLEFLQCLDSWFNLNFISAGLFNIGEMRDGVKMGYHYITTMMPHVAMLLSSLDDRSECVLLPQEVVHYHRAEVAQQYGKLGFFLGRGLIMDLPLSREERRLVSRAMGRVWTERIVLELIAAPPRSPLRQGRFYFLRQCVARNVGGGPILRDLALRAQSLLAFALLAFPGTAHRLANAVLRWKRHDPAAKLEVPDSQARL